MHSADGSYCCSSCQWMMETQESTWKNLGSWKTWECYQINPRSIWGRGVLLDKTCSKEMTPGCCFHLWLLRLLCLGLGVCLSLLSAVPAPLSGSSSLCLLTCEIYCLKARLLASQSRQPEKHSHPGRELYCHVPILFRVDAHECRACNEKWTTKRGVSKDMGGVPWWARTWRQRALGRSNGQPCPLVLSPVPPHSSPPLPLAHPVVRLLNEEDKEMKEMWHLTTWEEPKCASRKDAERTSPLPPASTLPPDPPSHRGVAWVLAGVSFLIQFKQCRHDAHLPFCFCMSPGQGVARWVLWSSTLQLGVCRSAVGGDVHN